MSNRRGMVGWRGMSGRLDALLASVAVGSCVVRTLNADEGAIRFRLADGLGVFNGSRRSRPDRRRRGSSRRRRIPHGPAYRGNHDGIIGSAPAAVSTICHVCAGISLKMPDGRVTGFPLTRRLMPPIGRTRMITFPDNDIVVPPVKVAIQPRDQSESRRQR